MTAVPLIFGTLQAEHYEDDFHAAHPLIDELRNKMEIVEDPRYSREYLEADKRSIANAVQVFFRMAAVPKKWRSNTRSAIAGAARKGIPLLEEKFQGQPGHALRRPALRADLWRCAGTRRLWRRRRCSGSWRCSSSETASQATRPSGLHQAVLLEPAFHAHFDENLGGDFLHRKMRGIDVRDVFAAEQVFHLAHLELALGVAGVAAVGLALVADGGQAVGVDGQAEQLVLVAA